MRRYSRRHVCEVGDEGFQLVLLQAVDVGVRRGEGEQRAATLVAPAGQEDDALPQQPRDVGRAYPIRLLAHCNHRDRKFIQITGGKRIARNTPHSIELRNARCQGVHQKAS